MFGQPRGVLSLASTEMWERFSFYTMQSILVLYAGASLAKGGMGWDAKTALLISGMYGAAVYATPVLGGFVADKFIGAKKSVALGGILMCIGHFVLALHSKTAFFSALVLLCVGCGLLKPSITSMVGECYSENDTRRESGFSIFYMAINVGGFAGPFLAGSLSDNFGYHVAFVVAGFGLIVGLLNFYYACQNGLKDLGNQVSQRAQEHNPPPKLTRLEKQRMYVFMGMCVANIVWNVVYALPYGLLTLYAEKNIERTFLGLQIPPTWFYGMYSVFIIAFSPLLGGLYNFLARKKIPFTLSYKLAVGYLSLAIGCAALLPTITKIAQDPHVQVPSTGLMIFYVIFAFSELLTVPVLLAAATRLSTKYYATRMVSFNIVVSWSMGAWISGVVSSWTVNVGAILLFKVLIAACTLFGLLHILINRKVESLCQAEGS